MAILDPFKRNGELGSRFKNGVAIRGGSFSGLTRRFPLAEFTPFDRQIEEVWLNRHGGLS
jgi:hypothetical protein